MKEFDEYREKSYIVLRFEKKLRLYDAPDCTFAMKSWKDKAVGNSHILDGY